jgi:hypothetical protein
LREGRGLVVAAAGEEGVVAAVGGREENLARYHVRRMKP